MTRRRPVTAALAVLCLLVWIVAGALLVVLA